MLRQSVRTSLFYCEECDLNFGDLLSSEKNLRCPLCEKLIFKEEGDVFRISREVCQCKKCGTRFGAPVKEAVEGFCPNCSGCSDEGEISKDSLGNKPRPVWRDPMESEDVKRQAQKFIGQNICYGKDKIIGFPGTAPKQIAIEVYSECLSRHSNNIGMHTNKETAHCEIGFAGTQKAEGEVIAMLADLMSADTHEVDGYITSGGTEANLVGCWMGRDAHPQGASAIVCSYLTHYSIMKAANILGTGIYPNQNGSGLHVLGTDENGHLLLAQLEKKLFELATKNIPNIIVVANAGSTMLGSVDNIPLMDEIVGEFKNKFPAINFHFHIDAAFGGFVIPFIKTLPKIDFSNPNVDSMTIDLHKMGLTPYGSGALLARRGLFERTRSVAPYIPGDDCTLCGSRSGAMAVACWATMKGIGKKGYEYYANHLVSLADAIRLKFDVAGFQTFRNDINIVAVKGAFPFSLRNIYVTHVHEKFPVNLENPLTSESTTVWNVVVMNHTTTELIDEFILKLKDEK